jgi:hypothetical protein
LFGHIYFFLQNYKFLFRFTGSAHGVFGNSKKFGCFGNGNVGTGLDFGNMRGGVFEQGLFPYLLFLFFQPFFVCHVAAGIGTKAGCDRLCFKRFSAVLAQARSSELTCWHIFNFYRYSYQN